MEKQATANSYLAAALSACGHKIQETFVEQKESETKVFFIFEQSEDIKRYYRRELNVEIYNFQKHHKLIIDRIKSAKEKFEKRDTNEQKS